MNRIPTSLVLLALIAPAMATAGSIRMWGCAPPGQRGNALVLVDRGPQSYVKISRQRVAAELSAKGDEQQWSWGSNRVVLGADLRAQYYEGEVLKGTLKCKRLGGD